MRPLKRLIQPRQLVPGASKLEKSNRSRLGKCFCRTPSDLYFVYGRLPSRKPRFIYPRDTLIISKRADYLRIFFHLENPFESKGLNHQVNTLTRLIQPRYLISRCVKTRKFKLFEIQGMFQTCIFPLFFSYLESF